MKGTRKGAFLFGEAKRRLLRLASSVRVKREQKSGLRILIVRQFTGAPGKGRRESAEVAFL
ncbi:MAG: hypothetical protein CL799_04165 [Chromatiales bacterium]|jgi:hypothetical protein|nr:hypothetical protein [Chromatiales bacterium]